ncbi:MAG: PQQ-binding-like beta-propeller repeat protein [Vicinamibacterales bacterium]
MRLACYSGAHAARTPTPLVRDLAAVYHRAVPRSRLVLPLLVPVLPLVLASGARAQTPDGAAVYKTHCASCHDGDAGSRAPSPEQLKDRSPAQIIDALTGGAMRYQGLPLSGAERRAVAEFLTGRPAAAAVAVDPMAGRCTAPRPFAMPAAGQPAWNGWGPTVANTHFQPAAAAGLTAADVPKLTLAWAFGVPEATSAWGPPTGGGGRRFGGRPNGHAYALDAKTGCVLWNYEAEGGVRSAIAIGPQRIGGRQVIAAYFSDQRGYAYALDARDGREIWKRRVDPHPLVRLTGSVALHGSRLYVPTSSYEEVGKGPAYACCTFRGALVAMDAATGDVIWRAFMVGEPVVMGTRPDGIESLGPSGGAIWSAPTIDERRRLIYVATGNTYSGRTQPLTEAVVALDLETGAVRWAKQVTPDDVYGCRSGEPNCGETQGPDFDFGASPIVARTRAGREIVVAGQKSGVAYALDPDRQGEILWQYRAGKGGTLGGIEWGIAIDGANVYLPVADNTAPEPGGLHAVDLATGQRAWFAPPPSPLLCGPRARGCTPAQSAAVTVIPGVVFSGAFDGGLRAYSTVDGRVLWTADTNGAFTTVNGVQARGASLNGPGPVIVDGMLYVGSGDYRGRTGNVLLAYRVK